MDRLFWRFLKNDEGSILHFTLIFYVAFLAAAGMGADFMRHELYRAELQNALDRGVLAATSFGQTENPVDIITHFVEDSEKWTSVGDVTNVSISRTPADASWFEQTVHDRSIRASADVSFGTFFLRLLGINSMDITVTSSAMQSRKPVEVVMLLDISASMDAKDNATNQARIYGLRTAAKAFIDNVLTPETQDLTAITLIPFGGTVNPGDFAPYLNLAPGALPSWADPTLAGYPACPIFSTSDFDAGNEEAINTSDPMEIMKIFKNYKGFPGVTGEKRWSWCPAPSSGIVAMSNDAQYLKDRIDDMRLYDGTGIDIGFKWGMFAMSPNARPMISQMVSSGLVSPNFSSWPNDFDGTTEKYVIMLTDGGITEQFNVRDALWEGTIEDLVDHEDIFANAEEMNEAIGHMSAHYDPTDLVADYWSLPNPDYLDPLLTSNTTIKNFTRNSHGENVTTDSDDDTRFIKNALERLWGKSQATQHVENICRYLKADGPSGEPRARMFTIGFNLDVNGVAPVSASATSSNKDRIKFVLDYCATSEEDEFLATSATLDSAFSQIASQINSLRLGG